MAPARGPTNSNFYTTPGDTTYAAGADVLAMPFGGASCILGTTEFISSSRVAEANSFCHGPNLAIIDSIPNAAKPVAQRYTFPASRAGASVE